MELRAINQTYETIANKLIEEEAELKYIKNSKVKITYLESDLRKKKGNNSLVLGECEKVQAKNRWAISSDFTITVYRNNCVGLSDEQIKIILFHELLHVGIALGQDGTENYTVNPHDLEDFKIIIDRYGTDWSKARTLGQ